VAPEESGLRVYATKGPSWEWPSLKLLLGALVVLLIAAVAVPAYMLMSAPMPPPPREPEAVVQQPASAPAAAAPAPASAPVAPQPAVPAERPDVEQLRQELAALRGQLAAQGAAPQRAATACQVANGGFEEAEGSRPLFWAPETHGSGNVPKQPFMLDRESRHGGVQSLRFDTIKDQFTHLRHKQLVPVEPRHRYVLRGWIKTENVTGQQKKHDGGAHLRVKAGTAVSFSPPVFDTADWQELKVEFKTDDVQAVEIYVELGYYGNVAAGTAWFDDISIEPQDEAKAPAKP